MNKKVRPNRATKLFWSFFLGLSLALGLAWAVMPRPAAEAQDVDFNFVVDPLNTAPAESIDAFVPSLPRDEGKSSNEQLATSFVEPHSSMAASAPASPSPRDEKPPDFASFTPTYPYGPRTDSGAPLFTSPGNVLNTRSRSDLATPPLPGSTDLAVCMTSDRVWGVVGAGATTTVTVDGTQMGAAAADGNGFFWTTLYDGNGDRPELSGGEIAAIYSDGAQEANITLHTITGTIDVVSDVVSGTIGDVSSPISVTVYAPSGEPSMTSYSQTVSTDGSGNFTADFTSIWDLFVWDEATAAYAESGVEVHRHIYPEDSLLVRPAPWNVVMGTASPGTIVTATLYFSDTTEKDSNALTAGSTDGWYYWSVPTDVLESDIVAVEFEDGMVMSRTIDTFTIDDVEVANDRIVGQAEPGAIVRGLVDDLTPQGWRDVTMSTTADATGVYTLDFGTSADLMPGHWNAVFVADAEGDDLNLWHRAPSVDVNQTWNDISGVGPSDPGPDSDGRVVTLTLASTTTLYTTEMDWYSWYSFSQDDGLPDIDPEEIITVEAEGYAWQGVVEVMTMTAQHDTGADQFTGEVETPTGRVELWGTQWEDFGVQWLYPVGGQFDTLVTASSPFTATPAGFDVRNGVGYEVRHRTADDYLERIYREVDYLRVWPQYNGVMALFGPAGTPYTITLRDSGGGFKAQLTGTSNDPIGEAGWNPFGGTGEQIETGDQLQAQSATGFSQTVYVPAMDLQLDEANDRVSGSAPANSLLYVQVSGQGEGFVPTDENGQYTVVVGQLQNFYSNGDLMWGDGSTVCIINQDANQVCRNFQWPQIIANYNMEGSSNVWGNVSIPGNTIYITVTHPISGVIATGTTAPGTCDGCWNPTGYTLDLPDDTIAPGNKVTVDFGDGSVDFTDVVTITGNPDPGTDLVTGTAPANGTLHANAEHIWGDWIDINDIPVDASGVYTINFGGEGWDIQYGDQFNIHYDADHGHQTQYSFVAFSGGEVEWVDLNVDGTNIWGCGYSGPVTITTAGEERTYGGDCWDDDFDDPFQPGDVVTVAAGEGTHPVVIHIPDPFTANASSITDTVWGQIDALDHEQVNVNLDDGPDKDVQTDGSGNYSATFSDVPRGGRGWVNYQTTIDYADVHFHRQFQSPDLILRIDYTEDGVDGNYEAGHTGWITVTEADGVTIKATCEITTAAWPWWGGNTGFSTHHHNWTPDQPDIVPGDWVYGELDNGYTSDARVGTIDGAVNVNTDVVSGTIQASWITEMVDVRCQIHEDNGPGDIYVPNVDPDGGTFFCDFSGTWDIQPGHNVVVNYTEPDRDQVQTHPPNPAPYLRLNKNSTGEPGEGGNYGFQIQYWNDGGADAENTVITDTLLYGMTYLTDTASFTHTGSGQPGDPLVWHVGTLPANSSGQFAVMVEVTATAGARITNTARIATSDPYGQGEFWEKYSEWSGEVQNNDTRLNVGKGAWTGDPAPGYNFVYNVNVCNNGSTASSEVVLTDTLHPSTTLQTWWGQHPGWTELLSSNHQLVVSHPSIPGGWCSEVYLRVHLTDTAKAGDWITNTAVITASNDLESNDNEMTWWGQVSDPHTNLYINKHWNWGQLVPGGEIRYNIDYQNNGNVPVTSTIRITDTLPMSTTFVAAWDYDQYGNPSPVTPVFTGTDHVVWEIAGLDNGFGDNFEIALNVDGHADPGTVLTNTVEISPQPNEESYDDNVATVVEMLYDHGPNLRVRKEGNWDDWGENTRRASYNLTVENVGDAPVAPVFITDTYDSKMYLDGDIGVNYWQWWDWGDDSANHTFTVTLESLQGGERIDINFGTITDTEPLPFGLVFTNTAEVMLDPDDVNPDDNVDDVVLTTGPDLYVKKELVAGELLPGELITFSLRFGNDHQGHEWWWNTQGRAWLTDTLPSGFEFVTATRRSWGWAPYTPDYDDGTHIAWNTGSMPTGGEDELLVVMSITDTATGLDTFTNQVEIASTEPTSDTEPYYDNNSDSYDVPIALPNFEIGKVYESNRVAGMPVTYTLTVTNSGNAAGNNVVLSDTLPAGVAYGGSSGNWTGSTVTWTFGTVAANGGTATGWLSGTLPCSGTVTNDDYRVVDSDEGVDSASGAAVSLSVIAPTISPAFDQSTTKAVVSATVRFTDTSTTNGPPITEWEWDFGDGSAHTFTQNASHTYLTDDTFTVTLTITDACGYSEAVTAMLTIIEGTTTSVDPVTGGTLVYTDTQGNPTTIEVPGGGVEDPVTLLYGPILSPTQPISPNLRFADHAFDLEAYRDGIHQAGLVFSKPVTITIRYSNADVEGINDEDDLWLYYWTGSAWADAASTCTPPSTYDRHPDANWLSVPVCHLTEFGLMGGSGHRIYLPLVVRNS